MKKILFYLLSSISVLLAHDEAFFNKISTLEAKNKIPKIIHQIWIGKNKIHPECIKAMETWKEIHPDWEYKLWTDKDIASFEWTNKELFLLAENVGTKADIWRYEILHKYGGLYVDVDFVCLKPFDLFHERLSFYSGFIWHLKSYDIANGLIACKSGHPILKKMITSLSTLKYKNKKADAKYIMKKVGQGLLTKCVAKYNPFWKKRDIIKRDSYIFSPGVFYPIDPNHWRAMEANNLQIPEFLEKKLEDAYAVHLYARSWVPKDDKTNK